MRGHARAEVTTSERRRVVPLKRGDDVALGRILGENRIDTGSEPRVPHACASHRHERNRGEMSAVAKTVALFKQQRTRDAAVLRKIRARAKPEEWTRDELFRVNDLSKYFLGWYFGVMCGLLGFRSFGFSVWGLALITIVSNLFVVNYLNFDLDLHGEPMEFVLSGMVASYCWFILWWVIVAQSVGRF